MWKLPHSIKPITAERFVQTLRPSLWPKVESVDPIMFAVKFKVYSGTSVCAIKFTALRNIRQISDAQLPSFLLSLPFFIIVCGEVLRWVLAKKSINFICIVLLGTWYGWIVLWLRVLFVSVAGKMFHFQSVSSSSVVGQLFI